MTFTDGAWYLEGGVSDPEIGTWVRRRSGKWHLVESTIAGDVVTRCGRRMDRVIPSDRLPLKRSVLMPLTRMIGQPQLCKAGCERAVTRDQRANGMPEDDGSTAPVDAPDVPS